MRELIVDLKKRWDIILFDSPPIAAVTDATTMAQSLDSMVIVVKAGFTPKESFFRALSAIEKVQTPLTGVVLNSVTKTNTYDTYYYSYQQQYYYYESRESE